MHNKRLFHKRMDTQHMITCSHLNTWTHFVRTCVSSCLNVHWHHQASPSTLPLTLVCFRVAGHPLAQNERCLHMFLQEESVDKNYTPSKIRQAWKEKMALLGLSGSTLLSLAWPQLGPTTQSSLHCSRFLSDNKHSMKNLPSSHPQTIYSLSLLV